MKATELRLNNLVLLNGKEIYEIEDFRDAEVCEPIPLTEEWLLKFGFVFDGVRFQQEVNNNLWVFVKDNKWGWYSPHIEISNGIEYVHTFQNLMFALTGEELTIKE